MRRIGVAIVVALTLTGCLATSNADGDYTITDTVDGQDVRLDLPGERDPIGVAVWFHGQGADADSRMNEEWLNALRVEGWAVASSDLYGSNWGSREATEHVAELVGWAERQTSGETRLFIAGSMGGLSSLNAMIRGENPGCWYGTMPVIDPTTTGNVPDATKQLAEVWPDGVPDEWNPSKRLADLPDASYRVLTSPQDDWVPAEQNGLLLVAQGATERAVAGEHGDPSHFNSKDLTDFAATCL